MKARQNKHSDDITRNSNLAPEYFFRVSLVSGTACAESAVNNWTKCIWSLEVCCRIWRPNHATLYLSLSLSVFIMLLVGVLTLSRKVCKSLSIWKGERKGVDWSVCNVFQILNCSLTGPTFAMNFCPSSAIALVTRWTQAIDHNYCVTDWTSLTCSMEAEMVNTLVCQPEVSKGNACTTLHFIHTNVAEHLTKIWKRAKGQLK